MMPADVTALVTHIIHNGLVSVVAYLGQRWALTQAS